MTEQEGFIAAIADRDSLIKRLANDYANDADTMAAAHKAERDALKEAAKLAMCALIEIRDNGFSWDAEYDKAINSLKAVL